MPTLTRVKLKKINTKNLSDAQRCVVGWLRQHGQAQFFRSGGHFDCIKEVGRHAAIFSNKPIEADLERRGYIKRVRVFNEGTPNESILYALNGE